MQRFVHLFSALHRRFPRSEYLVELLAEARKKTSPHSSFRAYGRALESLDADSWELIRQKATERFRENPNERGQARLFDVLNEALAYRFLLRHGCDAVRCIPEPKGKRSAPKTPDITFRQNHTNRLCEVKTIHQSDYEFRRVELEGYSLGVYANLPTRFFSGKLKTVLQQAAEQLRDSHSGLVFIVMHFDDIGPYYRSRYTQQLHEYFAREWPNLEVYGQFGISGSQYVHHLGNSGEAAA